MAKFNVTLYYHTNVTVEVEAANEQEAKQMAYSQVGTDKYNQQLLDGMQEDSAPDVEQVE